MATSAMMVEWGMPIEGRETKALETFMSSMAWFEELKGEGKIEGVSTYGMMTGNYAKRSGFTVIEGTDEQMRALRDLEKWRVMLVQVASICHDVEIHDLETGDAMTTRMQRYGGVVKDLLG